VTTLETADPLTRLLAAAAETGDPLVRDWLARLADADGERPTRCDRERPRPSLDGSYADLGTMELALKATGSGPAGAAT
jgi:hypothetical protein